MKYLPVTHENSRFYLGVTKYLGDSELRRAANSIDLTKEFMKPPSSRKLCSQH